MKARFETLDCLPTPLPLSQCVVYKDEILICGGFHETACYSYHTKKKQYKQICSYPKDVKLFGHCVVKRVNQDNPNAITLLSFGGKYKHTLVMNYVSVWTNVDSDDGDEDDNKEDQKKEIRPSARGKNTWLPFTDKQNRVIQIGRPEDYYDGARAVIGGSLQHLLFITYAPKHIDVFNLDTYTYVLRSTLPLGDDNTDILYHCFVCKTMPAMDKSNITEMVLFYKKLGFAITYDETKHAFEFQKLTVSDAIAPFVDYAYVYINGDILFFGGDSSDVGGVSKAVHKYSTKEKKWTKFDHTLPVALSDCIGIVSEDHSCVHILGGFDHNYNGVSTHLKTDARQWLGGVRDEDTYTKVKPKVQAPKPSLMKMDPEEILKHPEAVEKQSFFFFKKKKRTNI
ncbi:hypothetical protein RFI_09878 [Reticulomyxa filosa]|uniref:Kelch motif family protein n=1 Tax=Reticulomyxa filosa TaxID=46433 RepID=X6NNG1_RETFI|nr:hypothetical protein RFI_09878 [Reticulomyxa filosa]|eukprot:ETO27254.1 hypothetical protein RFI_09878 [Reticulomyxa filosa]